MKKQRPDSNIAKLSERAYQCARAMVESRSPAYTAEQIIAEIANTYGEHLNRNNVTALRAQLSEEAERERELALHRSVLANELARTLHLDEDGADLLRRSMQGAILANDTSLKTVSPEKIMRLVMYDERTKLLKEKLKNERERLALDNQRLQLEVEKLEREKEERNRIEAERKRQAEAALEQADQATTPEERARIAYSAIKEALSL